MRLSQPQQFGIVSVSFSIVSIDVWFLVFVEMLYSTRSWTYQVPYENQKSSNKEHDKDFVMSQIKSLRKLRKVEPEMANIGSEIVFHVDLVVALVQISTSTNEYFFAAEFE